MLLCWVLLFSCSVYAETCTFLPKACPHAQFANPTNWNCGHIPGALSNVIISLSTVCTITSANTDVSVESLTVTGKAGIPVTLALVNTTFMSTTVVFNSAELSLVNGIIRLTSLTCSNASLTSTGAFSSVYSNAVLDLSNLLIKTRWNSTLTLHAPTHLKAKTNTVLMVELPPVVSYENNFTANFPPQINIQGTWNDTTGASLIIYAEPSVYPEFAVKYPLISGDSLSTLQRSLNRNVTLRTRFSQATFSMDYEENVISMTYISPGHARRPENSLLSINEDNSKSKYWVAVTWQGNKNGDCDPDLTFSGTELIFDKKNLLEKNDSGTIPYPETYTKCSIVAFRALNTCTATINSNGKITKVEEKSPAIQSSPLLIVLPLASPLNGTNGTVSCELDKMLYRNCTILLDIPAYDCGCGGEVSSYEFNTTCKPLHVQDEFLDADVDADVQYYKVVNGRHILNCTASNFTSAIMYRANCKWHHDNAPQGTYHSDWSIPHVLNVTIANLTNGNLVPRPPMPLAVIIVSGIVLAIGMVMVAWVMVKRRGEWKGYQSVQ